MAVRFREGAVLRSLGRESIRRWVITPIHHHSTVRPQSGQYGGHEEESGHKFAADLRDPGAACCHSHPASGPESE